MIISLWILTDLSTLWAIGQLLTWPPQHRNCMRSYHNASYSIRNLLRLKIHIRMAKNEAGSRLTNPPDAGTVCGPAHFSDFYRRAHPELLWGPVASQWVTLTAKHIATWSLLVRVIAKTPILTNANLLIVDLKQDSLKLNHNTRKCTWIVLQTSLKISANDHLSRGQNDIKSLLVSAVFFAIFQLVTLFIHKTRESDQVCDLLKLRPLISRWYFSLSECTLNILLITFISDRSLHSLAAATPAKY